MDTPCTDKFSEYQRRYQFWSERAVEQFSFSNNLLLTISIATLGYSYKVGKEELIDLIFCCPCSSNPLDLKATLFSLGTIFTVISIFSGLVVTMARLYDFRLTRHITLIRKRVYLKHVKIFPSETPKSVKNPLGALWELFTILFEYSKIKISESECQEFNRSLKNKFLKLRATIIGLGNLSWFAFSIQFIFFFLGYHSTAG